MGHIGHIGGDILNEQAGRSAWSAKGRGELQKRGSRAQIRPDHRRSNQSLIRLHHDLAAGALMPDAIGGSQ